MHTAKMIGHRGFVKSIKDNIVTVNITQVSACAACHAKSMCTLADVKDKEVEIISMENYAEGEEVNVGLHQSMGVKALFLGYVIPFVIVFVALIIFSQLTLSELTAGLASLFLLAPYYCVLYFSRNRLRETFTFTINKLA